MAVQSYELKHYSEDGRLYVVVTLDDGSTFGQLIQPGSEAEMDAEVEKHAARFVSLQNPAPLPELGVVRTKQEMEAAKSAPVEEVAL